MDATLAIDVRGLTKSYQQTRAVAGVDLQIRRGEIFALLGPNGAGKTTTVEILEGYRSRDGGEVSVLGLDPGSQRPARRPAGIPAASGASSRARSASCCSRPGWTATSPWPRPSPCTRATT